MDVRFRVNGPYLRNLRTTYRLAEFIPQFPQFRGNGPRRAAPDLCSTRAGGKDDGSLHKSLQTKQINKYIYIYIYININIYIRLILGPPFGPWTPGPILVDVAICSEYVDFCRKSFFGKTILL